MLLSQIFSSQGPKQWLWREQWPMLKTLDDTVATGRSVIV